VSARREEILAIARRQFAENGYHATSMRTLAEASGLLAGSLYSHFRSKAEAVQLVVLAFYDELLPAQQQAFDSPGDGAARLAVMIDSVFHVCARHDLELIILHYDWRALAKLDELAEVVRRSEQTLRLWEQVVAAGVADGSLRADADPKSVMRVITSGIHGLLDFVRHEATRAATGGPAETPPDIEAMAALLQRMVLQGLRA
jgi:TetR/AcrR family transcriptional regulator, cholesterol catabolism regulator